MFEETCNFLWVSLYSGQLLDCSLARPQADQKSGGLNSQRSGLIASYPPRAVLGVPGGAYGALGAGYGAAGFAQVRYVLLHFT